MLSFLSEASGDPHLLLSSFVSLFVKLHQSSNITVSLETLGCRTLFRRQPMTVYENYRLWEYFTVSLQKNVRMPLLELLGRNLLIMLSIFPAESRDHNCLVRKEFYMHSLNVAFKNFHSRLLCKEILVGITKCLKKNWPTLALGWSYVA